MEGENGSGKNSHSESGGNEYTSMDGGNSSMRDSDRQ